MRERGKETEGDKNILRIGEERKIEKDQFREKGSRKHDF